MSSTAAITAFVKEIDGLLKKVIRHKALQEDTTNYVLRITHKELKVEIKRQRITLGILNSVARLFELAGHTVELEEDSIKITALSVFAVKPYYTLNDLMTQSEIIKAR